MSNRDLFQQARLNEMHGVKDTTLVGQIDSLSTLTSSDELEPPRIHSNPYDSSQDSDLGHTYIDINCPCVEPIRKSRCNMVFESFANCHNVVIYNLYKRKNPPLFQQCSGQYKRLMLCLEKNDMKKAKLIDDPENRITRPLGSTLDDIKHLPPVSSSSSFSSPLPSSLPTPPVTGIASSQAGSHSGHVSRAGSSGTATQPPPTSQPPTQASPSPVQSK